MGILDTLLQGENSGAISTLARQFGIGDDQATEAIKHLGPAVSAGLRKNMQSQDGLSGLLSALQSGNHQRYLDHPDELTRASTMQDGNAILGHIFGSKDVSRQVASRASQQTGLDIGVLKKMLPLVASLAMGSMSKQSNQAGIFGAQAQAPSADAGGMLGKFLDADGDGSMMDDLWGMAKKFF